MTIEYYLDISLKLTRRIQKRDNKENTYTIYSSESEPETKPPSSDDSDSEFEEDAEVESWEASMEEGWCGDNQEDTIQKSSENQSGEGAGKEEEKEENTGRGKLVTDLKYHEGADRSLKNTGGVGSARTEQRKQQEARILKAEASKCYDIRALWERDKMRGICKDAKDTREQQGEGFFEGENRIPLLEEVSQGCSPPTWRPNSEEREAALADMLYLLSHKKKVKEKYGDEGLTSTLKQYHEMVL